VNAETEKLAQELQDRREILACLNTYCRGIDRLDREIFRSAYHPDAIDDHGTDVFVGKAYDFIDYIIAFHREHQQRTMHLITTHLCELNGDVANTETYYIVRLLNRQSPFFNLITGRYLDRMEKRQGRWAIAQRTCLVEILDENLDPQGTFNNGSSPPTFRDSRDPSYRRPFNVDRARVT
jgi:hypothetical protein